MYSNLIMRHNPMPLSGSQKGTFPYLTIKDRLPVILTHVIDHLCREKDSICQTYGKDTVDDLKEILGKLSQLKNEMQTNKILKSFDVSLNSIHDDDILYNNGIENYKKKFNCDPKWFEASWLFVENYFYKKIHKIFMSSKSLSSYDPFNAQKIKAYENAHESIKFLSRKMVKEVLESSFSEDLKKKIVMEIIEISLWGNQCDLSISGGENRIQECSFTKLASLKENIIANDLEIFWEYLINLPKNNRHMAIILDNAGLELFADMCLASTLIEFKLVDYVSFYTKTRPWFVSDTTLNDWNGVLDSLMKSEGDIGNMGKQFKSYLDNGIWDVKENKFWTTHHDYSEMKKVDPILYEELKTYSFAIFKGDLNYRKLVGDLDWPNNTSLQKALRGFQPCPLLILRTIKGGPTVGLDESSPRVKNAKLKENWCTSGEMGNIQFISHYYSDLNLYVSLLISSTIVIFIAYIFKLLFK